MRLRWKAVTASPRSSHWSAPPDTHLLPRAGDAGSLKGPRHAALSAACMGSFWGAGEAVQGSGACPGLALALMIAG